MCGLSGFIDNKINYDGDQVLGNMIFALNHRGPDNYNLWKSQNDSIYVAHSRLSIRDLSIKSNQPIVSDNKRYVLSYNGEIYNNKDLSNFIQKKFSYYFSDSNTSDTILLLKLIELNGVENSLSLLNGMFAFSLFDKKENNIYLVRDNFGQKPLYFTIKKNFFCFASELKALQKHPKINFEINPTSINQFLNFSYISAPETVYKGINQLEAGSYLKISCKDLNLYEEDKNFQKQKYIIYKKWWSPKKSNLIINKEKNYLDTYSDLLYSNMQMFVQSDVAVGTFLSGGIDSSLITSICNQVSKNKISTFTVGFKNQIYDESNIS